jgi:hypothetical protein
MESLRINKMIDDLKKEIDSLKESVKSSNK